MQIQAFRVRLDAFRIQKSVWLINLDNSSREVKDHFKSYVDANDLLWVNEIFQEHYSFYQSRKGTNGWLDENPPNYR